MTKKLKTVTGCYTGMTLHQCSEGFSCLGAPMKKKRKNTNIKIFKSNIDMKAVNKKGEKSQARTRYFPSSSSKVIYGAANS